MQILFKLHLNYGIGLRTELPLCMFCVYSKEVEIFLYHLTFISVLVVFMHVPNIEVLYYQLEKKLLRLDDSDQVWFCQLSCKWVRQNGPHVEQYFSNVSAAVRKNITITLMYSSRIVGLKHGPRRSMVERKGGGGTKPFLISSPSSALRIFRSCNGW